MQNKLYPTDLNDPQGELIKELIPLSNTGRPRELDMRQVLNAILYVVVGYVVVGGIKWRMLPREYPNGNTLTGRVFTTTFGAGGA